jgi:hypothetical protein
MGVVNPTVEMSRLVGKFAFFFAGVYLLVLFGVLVSAATGEPLPLLAWPLLLLPAAAFVPAVLDGFRLHRTADPAVMKALWRRCLLFMVIAVVLLAATAVMVERMTP